MTLKEEMENDSRQEELEYQAPEHREEYGKGSSYFYWPNTSKLTYWLEVWLTYA